jgi:hypothetical protein
MYANAIGRYFPMRCTYNETRTERVGTRGNVSGF